ncbi:DsbA family oxidoreductase [Meridianimarinicoccus sp. MJW13]|uniref:DsbA family oxidoreductase n=1 Tax=Meridianimarinicoccus sp. MJW13 TaxID=2720031 RepID=UPI0018674CA8|nr:DsbA family oxidoreductase [Fluviibacterium sp. MJW13]
MTKLEIFSDPICPWCLIGKTRLDRALATQPDHPFQIAWYPFQLNPDMPAEGMDRRAYLEAKFGGRDGALRVYGQIAETAEAEGIEIDFAAIQRTPNTLNAHRLIHWAGIEGHQNAVVDALFAAYFQQGRDIGDIEVLSDIADACGLDAAVILKLLKSDVDVKVIREGDEAARKMGITAAPTFIVGGAHAVPGAQPTELWQKVISELSAAAS